jgi:hypothetical protein
VKPKPSSLAAVAYESFLLAMTILGGVEIFSVLMVSRYVEGLAKCLSARARGTSAVTYQVERLRAALVSVANEDDGLAGQRLEIAVLVVEEAGGRHDEGVGREVYAVNEGAGEI